MIPTSSEHKAEAEAYINFLLDPAVCGENLDYLGYSAPETAAKAYMDPEMVENEIAYPDPEILARSEAFLYLPQETNQLMDSLWLEVKTGGTGTTEMLLTFLAVVIVILAVLIGYSIWKRRRKARRGKYYHA